MNDKYITVIGERGQISVPAALRRLLRLKPGQRVHWQANAQGQIRLKVLSASPAPGPRAVFGYAQRFSPSRRKSSDQVLRELRAGDRD